MARELPVQVATTPPVADTVREAQTLKALIQTEPGAALVKAAALSRAENDEVVAEWDDALTKGLDPLTTRLGQAAAQSADTIIQAEEKDGKTFTDEEANQIFRQQVDAARALHIKRSTAWRGGVNQALQKGAADLYLLPDQRSAIEGGREWALKDYQIRLQVAKAAPKNRQAAILTTSFARIKKEADATIPPETPDAEVPARFGTILQKHGLAQEDWNAYLDLSAPRMGNPPLERGWLGNVGHAVETTGRVSTGAIAGGLKEAQAATAGLQPSQPSQPGFLESTPQYKVFHGLAELPAKVWGAAAEMFDLGSQGAGETHPAGTVEQGALVGKFGTPPQEAAQAQVGSVSKPLALPLAVGGAVAHAGQALASTLTADRVAGVPVTAKAGRAILTRAPSILAGAVTNAVKAGAWSSEEDDETSLANVLRQTRQGYKDQATREFPNDPAAADRRFKELAGNDAAKYFLDKPDLAQMFVATVTDPLNALPLSWVSKPLGAVLRKIPGVGPLRQAALQTFTRTHPGQFEIEKLAGGEAANQGARVAADRGSAIGSQISDIENQVTPALQSASGAYEKLPFETQQLGHRLMSSPVTGYQSREAGLAQRTKDTSAFFALPEKEQQAILSMGSANENAAALHQAWREKNAPEIYQSFAGERKGGVLKPGSTYQQEGGYVPARELTPNPDVRKAYGLKSEAQAYDPFASSQYEKHLPPDAYHPNPAVQWGAQFKGERAAASNAAENQYKLKSWMRGGAIRPVKAEAGEVAIQAEAKKLSETGTKWAPLDEIIPDKEINNIVSRLSGTPGEIHKGEFRYLVPVDGIGDNLAQTLVIAPDPRKPLKKGADLLEGINDNVLVPLNTIGRTLVVDYGGPVNMVNNLVSSGVLPLATVGLKALKPSAQAFGGMAMHASMSAGEKRFGGMAMRLADGTSMTFQQMYKILDDFGLVNLDKARWGRQASTGKGPGGWVAKQLKRGGEKLPNFWVNRLGENYQKAITFAAVLEGSSPAAIERALDMTSKLAGNYARMGGTAMKALNKMGMFYGWYSYVYPLFIKQLATHPQRVIPWVRAQNYLDRVNADNRAISPGAVPLWLRDVAVRAPASLQPPGKPTSHQHVMLKLNTPWTMMGEWLPLLQVVFTQEGRGGLMDLASPAFRMIPELLTGRDSVTGDRLAGFENLWDPEMMAKDLGWIELLGKNRGISAAESLLEPIGRPARNIRTLIKLFQSSPNTAFAGADYGTRLKSARDMSIFANIYNEVTGRATLPGQYGIASANLFEEEQEVLGSRTGGAELGKVTKKGMSR